MIHLCFFNDGAHPQFNTRPEHGWILQETPNQTGRKRLNIKGRVNAEPPEKLFAAAHDICNNAKYYHSLLIKEWFNTHEHVKMRRAANVLIPYSFHLTIEIILKLFNKEKFNSF
jgi:hypothetical protein